jgi:hypothetical protein
MTLRDQLDQIARLEEKISDTGLPIDERITASNEFRQALVNFWRSGGRELAEWAIRQGYNPELNAAIDAARAKEGK